MKSILIVILGCNILSILYDRVNTAINFANSNQEVNSFRISNFLKPKEKIKTKWLVTGGIKNDILKKDSKPEAETMMEILTSHNYAITDFIIDTNSTNTVENFIFLHNYINEPNVTFQDIYIVTSDFHHARAKKISDKISPNNKYKWVLGKEETTDLVFWERYHINNVDRDIQRAIYANNFTTESIKDEL